MNLKRITCLVLMMLMLPFSFADEGSSIIYYDYDTYFYGLKDADDNVILEPAYDVIEDFNDDGIAIVELENMYGVINDKGVELIKPTYEYLTQFIDGVAVAYKDDKAGIIDSRGKVIIPFEYSDLSHFTDGHAIAIKDGKIGLITKKNTIAHPFEWDSVHMADFEAGYKYFVVEKDAMYSVTNFKGDTVYGPDERKLFHFADDRIAYMTADAIGVITLDGKELFSGDYDSLEMIGAGYLAETADGMALLDDMGNMIGETFEYIEDSHENIIIVSTATGYDAYNLDKKKRILSGDDFLFFIGTEDNPDAFISIEAYGDDYETTYGLVSFDGEVLLETKYYDFSILSDNLIQYYNDEYIYGLFNTETKSNTGLIYDDVTQYEDGTIVITTLDGAYGLLDDKGNVIVEATLDYIYDDEKYYILNKDDKYALYDKKTRRVGSYKYDDFYKFEPVGKSRAAVVSVNGKYGFLKDDGSYLVAPTYDYLAGFNRGYAIMSKNDKYGFVNEKGQVVLEPTYEDMGDFIEDLAIAQLNGKYGFIKTNGQTAVPFKFENVSVFNEEGYAVAQIDGKVGLIDKSGRFIVAAEYDDMEIITNDMIMVYDYDEDKYGIVKSDGTVVAKAIYDDYGYFSESVSYIIMNEKYALINDKAEVLTPFMFDWIGSFYDGVADMTINGKDGVINTRGDYIMK